MYVFDTSALLSYGKQAFHAFSGEEVIIPLTVISELEKKRSDPELGLTSRSALRFVEELRSMGDIKTGVRLDDGTTVRIELNHIDTTDLPATIKNQGGNDAKILAVAKSLGATLVSQDLPLRIKAEMVGVQSCELPIENILKDDECVIEIEVTDYELSEFYADNLIRIDQDVPVNSNILLRSFSGGSALGVSGLGWSIRKVADINAFGVSGKNSKQRWALDHLHNEDITIVSLGGRSGSGKSLLAIISAIYQVKQGIYNKVIIHKPAVTSRLGGVEGALPGTEEEKYDGFTLSVFDAVEPFISRNELERMVANGSLQLIPTNHIRGRTYNNAICILDESQNAEFSLIATFISRMGAGSKAILTHDLSQIDSLYATKHGGIHSAIDKLSGNKLFAHVEFDKSLRSNTAELGASLMDDVLF